MKENKIISVLGASGSAGSQALDVARSRGYTVDFLSANNNASMIEDLAREFKPSFVAMADEDAAHDLKVRLSDTGVRVFSGSEGILEGIHKSNSTTVINAIIGEAGLMPTLAVIDAKKRLALANKESLVIAGDIVMSRVRENGVELLPVDSEHSAIFQSLKSGKESEIKKIILTASGGPFYNKTRNELKNVTPKDALAHPTWKMGKKITVDSATLMNKGFEVIEAVHLFSTPAARVEVVIHRQSILHSAVEYIDNTIIGEFSVPDMRMCVQYAVDYPDRCASSSKELDLVKLSALTFARPDYEAFPLLLLAKRAISAGGAMPAVLNASDEVAVSAFLSERLSFIGLTDTVSEIYEKMLPTAQKAKTLEEIIEFDRMARAYTSELIKEKVN